MSDKEIKLKEWKLAREEKLRVEKEEREKKRLDRLKKEEAYRVSLQEKLERNKKWANDEDCKYLKRKANEVPANENMKTAKKCRVSQIMCSMNSVGGVGFSYTK